MTDFGIYPGGVSGDDAGGLATGKPDDPAAVEAALDDLGVTVVRVYTAFKDAGEESFCNPADFGRYATAGRKLDLVAQFQSRSGDVPGYLCFLSHLVRDYGDRIATLQITEEPNVVGNATLDGDYPNVRRAIIEGVQAFSGQGFRIGFNTTPLFGPAASFVQDLVTEGGPGFVAALDYVGLDAFPDVFMPAEDPAAALSWLLGMHRDLLANAGLSVDIPLHLTENGWPTGPERSEARQAEVLAGILEVVAQHDLGAYHHFSLRDADTAKPGLFHRFGLMRDDYTPKPAYQVYRDHIARHSA
ncbi:hypothetical protein LTV02_28840 [Nocardia yamanashiensis]|uniref:hypothetical protein n=1 Tax=Nocardia yamanashiensis TaxID=209247 RepID=UPI001E57E60A|nr:hypothetical protein [Nocardia yamanashiensis]UGT40020.1 hypothetical protein LTV02_28840 [Nocardia yamanashiensis]